MLTKEKAIVMQNLIVEFMQRSKTQVGERMAQQVLDYLKGGEQHGM